MPKVSMRCIYYGVSTGICKLSSFVYANFLWFIYQLLAMKVILLSVKNIFILNVELYLFYHKIK